eukprot:CAMPEP_0177442350 /NCGR_PEP_ID=MMETSP0369-20130122/4891_1 /TAXON_ID=447022 ORGANISM="Scrippsiella hangoei-like, Strain SHHI-4" /NCGR_SAMPLE_ID=MMETSP0369 /ASSEMBLY_ACC=CAM_ASM_000364 /LENGTH=385 /DNA_ID=CAMNT_0018914277 /DNA_START=63 /DNA_END=1221 /DNA_ORIENTATION=+
MASGRGEECCSMRLISLVCLFVQNAGLVTLMRYTRTRRDRPMFLATTAVMVDEFSKLSLRFFMVWLHWYRSREDKKQGIDDFVRHLRRQFDVRSSLLMAVPALLYTVQKNLLYVALSNLDACVYQAAYTGKHITTALFSYLILGKQLNHWQKGSLLVLMFGVALVQISQLTESRKQTGDHPVLGFVAVALACCTSGFSSAYLEYFIKKADYWGKQVQLAVPALFSHSRASPAVVSSGFFQGYDEFVVLTIFFEVAGGLLVASVTKYADSIVKNFAIALSLTAVTAASALIWDFQLSSTFVLGTVITVGAAYMNNYTPPAKEPPLPDKRPREQERTGRLQDFVRLMVLSTPFAVLPNTGFLAVFGRSHWQQLVSGWRGREALHGSI